MTLVVGTRGLQPDEGILTRPGHRRRVAALRRYLTRSGVERLGEGRSGRHRRQDAATDAPVARGIVRGAYDRYGDVIYVAARVPTDDPAKARLVVQAFFDLYAFERGWKATQGGAARVRRLSRQAARRSLSKRHAGRRSQTS